MDSPGRADWKKWLAQVESHINENAVAGDVVLTQEELLDLGDLYRSRFTASDAAAVIMAQQERNAL